MLATKLRLPSPPVQRVQRPGLVSILKAGLDDRLVLVSAPAGYGKTTLLAEVLTGLCQPVGWVSLDEGDNDVSRFWAYLINALKTVSPEIGRSIPSLLQSHQPPPMEWMLKTLLNDIANFAAEFVIVLDDYHEIESSSIHESLGFFVEHLPPQVHFVISSRIDPPLPLSRLRVRGQLTEIRAGDLRFTPDETSDFLNRLMGLNIKGKDLRTLESRTEGWIAGLKMAGLSLKGKDDVSGFIADFSGSNRYVMDYLTEEVLNQQPPELRSFLIQTSILDRLNGSLCDAVTRNSGSEATLAELEKANLFITPLDDERRWYRYHQLFTNLLRNHLKREEPLLEPVLHLRASLWFEREGFLEKAIDHAMLAMDAPRGADLLEKASINMVGESRIAPLLSYMARFGEKLVDERPWLCVSFAWAALLANNRELLASMLGKAEAALSAHPNQFSALSQKNLHRIRGHVLAIRGYIAQAQGNTANTIAFSEESARALPADDLLAQSANWLNLGIAHWKTGDIAKAVRYIKEAEEVGRRAGNYYVALAAQGYLAELNIQAGELAQAADLCERAIKSGNEWGKGSPLPGTALAYVVLGQVRYEQNQLEEAATNLQRGIELGEVGYYGIPVLIGNIHLARLKLAAGDTDGALKSLEEAEKVLPQAGRAREAGQLPAWCARLALRRGDIEAAQAWVASQAAAGNDNTPGYGSEFDYLTTTRIVLARGKAEDRLPVFTRLAGLAAAQNRTGSVIEITLLQALVLQSMGNKSEALAAIEVALQAAASRGYVRTFVDEGAPLQKLLSSYLANGKQRDYAAILLKAMAAPSAEIQQTREPAAAGLVEPLSQRELEVLRLIAAGKSNRDIAEQLFLAIGTVKKHTNNILGKLGAESRTQAVACARQLNLIQ